MSDLTDAERVHAVAFAARLENETGVSVDGVPLDAAGEVPPDVVDADEVPHWTKRRIWQLMERAEPAMREELQIAWDARDEGFAERDAARVELAAIQSQVVRVVRRHRQLDPVVGGACAECGHKYPCNTIQDLGGQGE